MHVVPVSEMAFLGSACIDELGYSGSQTIDIIHAAVRVQYSDGVILTT